MHDPRCPTTLSLSLSLSVSAHPCLATHNIFLLCHDGKVGLESWARLFGDWICEVHLPCAHFFSTYTECWAPCLWIQKPTLSLSLSNQGSWATQPRKRYWIPGVLGYTFLSLFLISHALLYVIWSNLVARHNGFVGLEGWVGHFGAWVSTRSQGCLRLRALAFQHMQQTRTHIPQPSLQMPCIYSFYVMMER